MNLPVKVLSAALADLARVHLPAGVRVLSAELDVPYLVRFHVDR